MAKNIKVTGMTEVQARLAALGTNAGKAVGAGLYEAGETFMAWSAQFVPLDFGPLRASGRTERPVIRGTDVSVTVGYGGIAVPYALRVHEWDDPRVRWSVPGTGPFYLTRPLGEFSGRIPGIVANRVQREFLKHGFRR